MFTFDDIVVDGEVDFPRMGDVVKVACGPGMSCDAKLVESGDDGLVAVVLDNDVQDFDSTGKPLWVGVEVMVNSGLHKGIGKVVRMTEKCVFLSIPNIDHEVRVSKLIVSSLHCDSFE